MKTHLTILTAVLALVGFAAPAPAAPEKTKSKATKLLEEARQLERQRKYDQAMAKVEAGIKALEAGGDAEWQDNNTILWAAEMVRRNMLDHQKAIDLAQRVIDINDGSYWEINARMNMAETYRSWGKFDKAAEQYDILWELDERSHSRVAFARGQMLYFDTGDKEEGEKLLLEACNEKDLHHTQRIRGVESLVAAKLRERHDDRAIELLEMLPKLENLGDKTRDSLVARAYYQIGEVRRSMGQTDKAKAAYRKAMNHEGGEMRYRVMARDALEDIEYFE